MEAQPLHLLQRMARLREKLAALFLVVLFAALLLAVVRTPALAFDLLPLAYNSFESNKDDHDDDDESEWESRSERRERSRSRGLGKIDIDLKRPDSVVIGGMSENGLFVSVVTLVLFTGLVLGILFGRRKFKSLSRKLSRRKSRPTRNARIRSPRQHQILPHQCYTVLGIPASATDEEVRSRYKHLIKTFHSDKLVNRDLPEEVLLLTEEQFRKIQTAYETIRSERNMQ